MWATPKTSCEPLACGPNVTFSAIKSGASVSIHASGCVCLTCAILQLYSAVFLLVFFMVALVCLSPSLPWLFIQPEPKFSCGLLWSLYPSLPCFLCYLSNWLSCTFFPVSSKIIPIPNQSSNMILQANPSSQLGTLSTSFGVYLVFSLLFELFCLYLFPIH